MSGILSSALLFAGSQTTHKGDKIQYSQDAYDIFQMIYQYILYGDKYGADILIYGKNIGRLVGLILGKGGPNETILMSKKDIDDKITGNLIQGLPGRIEVIYKEILNKEDDISNLGYKDLGQFSLSEHGKNLFYRKGNIQGPRVLYLVNRRVSDVVNFNATKRRVDDERSVDSLMTA